MFKKTNDKQTRGPQCTLFLVHICAPGVISFIVMVIIRLSVSVILITVRIIIIFMIIVRFCDVRNGGSDISSGSISRTDSFLFFSMKGMFVIGFHGEGGGNSLSMLIQGMCSVFHQANR